MTAITKLTHKKIKELASLFKTKACNVSAMCEALGISRQSWYQWKIKSPDFADAIKETEASMIDFAETQLFKNIAAGKETSLIFYLLNRAPDRWQDKRNIEVKGKLLLIEADK